MNYKHILFYNSDFDDSLSGYIKDINNNNGVIDNIQFSTNNYFVSGRINLESSGYLQSQICLEWMKDKVVEQLAP